MLLGKDLQESQDLLGRERGEPGFLVLVGRIVASLEVHPAESIELERLAGGPEQIGR